MLEPLLQSSTGSIVLEYKRSIESDANESNYNLEDIVMGQIQAGRYILEKSSTACSKS
jgi:hypothetical protein